MWTSDDKTITAKQFYLIIRMIEADSILKISDFRSLESSRPTITKDILNGLMNQKEFRVKAAKPIAAFYLKDFPILKSIQTYDKQDLALALANIYHPSLLASDILHITEMTGLEAVAVASALLNDFDPISKRVDGTETLGEFIKYRDKPHLYFNAIETRRAYQYQMLFGVAFSETERYKKLGLDKPHPAITPYTDTGVDKPAPEHPHEETEIELQTVEYDVLNEDDWSNGDEGNENPESYLDEIRNEDCDKGSELEEVDYDDLRDID